MGQACPNYAGNGNRIASYRHDARIERAADSLNDKPDLNQEAVSQVNELTDSEPVNGEDLLECDDLKRQLREAKKSLLLPPSKT